MNDQLLISIIIPVFNASKYLKDTIQTVTNQSYNNWELLFIDDYSTDNSLAIITNAQKKDKRIKIFNNKVNSGAAITRNKGIKEAKGSFIAFLDADDIWVKNKLEKQVSFMQKNKYAFSFTSYEFVDSNSISKGKKVNVPTSINYKQALKNTIIWTTTVMFDMRILTKDCIYMPNIKSEDTACWWKVLKTIDFAYGMPEVLSFYRRSGNTLSSNKFDAIKRIWQLYRRLEHLNLLHAGYCFSGYAYNTVRKRI